MFTNNDFSKPFLSHLHMVQPWIWGWGRWRRTSHPHTLAPQLKNENKILRADISVCLKKLSVYLLSVDIPIKSSEVIEEEIRKHWVERFWMPVVNKESWRILATLFSIREKKVDKSCRCQLNCTDHLKQNWEVQNIKMYPLFSSNTELYQF